MERKALEALFEAARLEKIATEDALRHAEETVRLLTRQAIAANNRLAALRDDLDRLDAVEAV